jgi:RsiW-degrading membrane proteinase PrsW (M82 family)
MNETITLAALAAAPGLAISIYIYWKDKFEKEPRWLLVKCFLWGVFSTVPAVLFSMAGSSFGFDPASSSLWWSLVSCVIGIGLIEEFSKYFFIRRVAYRNAAFNEPFDGITYAVIVSMGFATLENFLYVFQYGFETAIVRMFLSVPAHAVFGVIIGYHLGREKYYSKPGAGLWGLALASILHGLFDFFLFNEYVFGSISGALLSFVLGLWYSFRAIRIHNDASPFNTEVR